MGGCATKPKDLKAEAAAAPAPAPKNDCTVSERKEVVVVELNEEIVDIDKHRSLSNLFKESEEAKDATENDKTPSETDKATCVDAPIDPKEENVIEVQKSTCTQAPEKAEEKKPDETEKIETCREKKPEEDKPATEENSQTPEIPMEKKDEEKEVIDIQTPEKDEEKDEEKVVTECQKSPEENKTEK